MSKVSLIRSVLTVVCLSLVSCASTGDPGSLAADYYNIANGYLDNKDYAKAREFFERALELNPKLYQGQFNLVQAYVLTDKMDDAQSLVDSLLTKDPDNALIRETEAYLLAKRGKLEESYALYKKLYEKGIARISILTNLVNIGESLKKYDDVYPIAIVLKTLTPDAVPLLGKLGLLALRLGKEGEADGYLGQYEQAIASDAKALSDYAQRLAGLEFYARAARAYTALTTLSPKDAEPWFSFAELQFLHADDSVGGKASFSKALELGFSDRKRLSALLSAVDETQRSLLMQVVQATLKDFVIEDANSGDKDTGNKPDNNSNAPQGSASTSSVAAPPTL